MLTAGIKRLTKRNRTRPDRTDKTPQLTAQPILQGAGIPMEIDVGIEQLLAPETGDIKVTREEKAIIASKVRERMQELPTLAIESVAYSLFSHEELEKIAAFKVTSTDKEGLRTVNDPRGGVVDNDKECSTCHRDNLSCPGHLGMISFNRPIIHPLFRREVIYILTSVCNSCGGLLCPEETLREKGILNLTGSKRLQEIAKESEKCPCRQKFQQPEGTEMGAVTGCIPNPYYHITAAKDMKKILYSYEGKKSGKDNIRTVEEVLNILSSISEEDAAILGFENGSHPTQFVMRSIPVIPICARAPVFQDGMILGDDLTNMYNDIASHNQKLIDDTLTENDKNTAMDRLIFSVEHMIDNSDSLYKRGTKKPFQDLKGRIQGKEAIIRNLIQGKRVNYSARTVLGPDPTLKFGQIRIPEVMAPYLTYPETVTAENEGRLSHLLETGKITHVTPVKSGRRLKIDDNKIRDIRLQHGDKVDRWLQNGDYVVFNRQPTLHKQGIMGYEVVLGKPMTIGLHLSYTSPHNADFDGDEGAIHAPQSEEAMLEVALLMSVNSNIMNAQNNKNIISVVYDALTGAFLLTQPETYVDRSTFSNIVSFVENVKALDTLYERLEQANVPITSGRALFSSILPEDFYYRKGDVLIKNGILLSGTINKDHIGSTHGSIIQVMMKDYGKETTTNFLTDIYNIMREWLNVRGFSVGLDDCYLVSRDPFEFYVDEQTKILKENNPGKNVDSWAKRLAQKEWREQWNELPDKDKSKYERMSQNTSPEREIQKEIQKAKMIVKSMGWKLDDPLEEERREKQIIVYLNSARGLGSKISQQYMAKDNAYKVMADSGAKGNTFNIAQITGILGQQFVQGQRMPMTISGGKRCTPYFPEDSLEPEARGFCVNSFLTGLTPSEMFFHQAGGREGLTDTAVKTAETGHMHHKIVKALEDIKVYEDGSARNAFGVVFQYAYGEDGFNAAMLELVNTNTGRFTSFINTKRLAARLNTKYGYSNKDEPEPEILEPKILEPKNTEFKVPFAPFAAKFKVGDRIEEGIVIQVEPHRIQVQNDDKETRWLDLEKGKMEFTM